AGALGFGMVLVAQRNPARGAIAFAFVILSVCGLFLLLAAPFLMAATVIIYAGAIIVTFLFVLMLSQNDGPSDENDRTREPLLGSLAGFAFVGLILFALGQNHAGAASLPAQAITPSEQAALRAAAAELTAMTEDAFYTTGEPKDRSERVARLERAVEDVLGVSGGLDEGTVRDRSIATRLRAARSDLHAQGVLARVGAARVRAADTFELVAAAARNPARYPPAPARTAAAGLRDDLLLLAGVGELPARNVANLGVLLYADHLLAVELAGTLLLVATIGTVAIAHRRGTAA
ncbi:MAG TPA: NADH-quinone oxidoreductase subunit J, partial [Urbifossiella sp.]|nr:NADH-quinone oxidoreductase subunit J [Urbifossiella sp.]